MANALFEKNVRKVLRDNRQSLDEINQHIWDTIVLNQLTNSEVAAMFTGLMRQVLCTENNKAMLSKYGIDEEHLNPEAVTFVQRIMTEEWLKDNGYLK